MKRLMIVIAAVLAIALIAIGIFIATFDINTYKGAIESQLSVLTGNRVEIGRLSFEWNGGVRLGLDGLKIRPDKPGEPVIMSLDRVEAGLDLAPILARRLQISSIYLARPNISVIRGKDGKIEFRGYSPKTALPAASGAAAPAALAFNVNLIRITDGSVMFADLSGEQPSEIIIKDIDADIRDVSLTTPVRFSVKAAVAGDRQNLESSGTVGGWLTGRTFLKDFDLKADLAGFGHSEIIRALPVFGKMGLKEGLSGLVTAKIRELEVSSDKLSKLSGDITIKDGKLVLSQVKVPIERISLDMSAEGTTVIIRSFSAQLANGAIKVAANIKDAFSAPQTELQMALEVRGLESFLSKVAGIYQNLDGNAAVTFKGAMAGGTWPEISRSLTGGGTFSLDSGVIINANVLDQSIGALTVFPNLVNTLQGTAPEPARVAMSEKYTVLKPLTQSYTIEGGYIILPDLILQSEFVDMRGAAKMSLTGDLSGAGMIRFSPAISGAMISAVPQMRAIADPQGLITFPIAFKGGSGTFKVIPDMKYIGTKVAVQTAGDAVSGYLKKAMEANGSDSSSAAAQTGSSKPPKIKDFLKALTEEK